MKPRLVRALVLGLVVSGVLAAQVVGCVDGVTPDCSGANAAQCGTGADASLDGGGMVLPEASSPTDAGDADAGGRDADATDGAADAGDGG